MIEAEVEIATADGAMGTFLTRPDEGGPFPVVFFYMDAPGKREELNDMARRIAATGYFVVLPNLYYRTAPSFELDFSSEASMKDMFKLMKGLSNQMIVSDTQAMIDFAEAEDAADASRIGCVGYCMSGPFSLAVAAAYPDRVKAAASIYGVRLAVDEPDSPHHGFSKTKAELYIAAAETDSYAPPEMIERVEAELAGCDVTSRVEWYPGTHHGFAFPGRGEVYDKAAAERHWSRLHSLFDRNLKG
jgi:carboxymethylenebutenolidase